jgi:hypothetical protein
MRILKNMSSTPPSRDRSLLNDTRDSASDQYVVQLDNVAVDTQGNATACANGRVSVTENSRNIVVPPPPPPPPQ